MCTKKITLLATLLALSISALIAQYRVELAVFEQGVNMHYFKELEKVQFTLDQNNLYRYYLGDFDDESIATSLKAKAVAAGFKYARVIDLEAEKALCNKNCGSPLYLHNILFDFDKATLTAQAKKELDHLVQLLKDNPDYKVELSAHTDSKGDPSYNISLSERRANSAKKYLLSNNIAEGRINIEVYGETLPVENNEINGLDNPKGRLFNRRVDFNVIDETGKILSNLVRPIRSTTED